MHRRCAARAVLTIAMGAGLAAAPSAGATDFSDRDLLTETLTLDEVEPLAEAQEELDVAESELRDARELEESTAAIAEGTAEALRLAQEELDAALAEDPQDPDRVAAATEDARVKAEADQMAQAAADAAAGAASEKQGVYDMKLAAVEAIEEEIAQTGVLVGELSAKQVHDLNASLQNARKTGLLPLDLDVLHLEAILDGGYGTREIHALTSAYEQEARFDRIALRFVERHEATGRDHFEEQAERFAARGDVQHEKFLEKLDRFEAQDAAGDAREAAKEAAAEERGDHGRHLAKGHGH
jgi:hypothetical protein